MVETSPSHDSRIAGVGRRLIWASLLAFLLLALIAVAAFGWARDHARAASDIAAQQQARSAASRLAGELQKFRLLPLVLIEYPEAHTVLAGGDAAAVRRMNSKLELLADRTDAAVIYLIDRDGRTIAASNWRTPQSFVGQSYGFRPYFRDAMAKGGAELFALGTVSGRPGLYIARRVEERGRTLGVIVVKVEFDRLESEWARQPLTTFVTDDHGVVIITSRPDWRFRTLAPIDEKTRAAIRAALQFGNLPLTPLPPAREGKTWTGGDVRYREAAVTIPMPGARLHAFQPLAPAEASANATARTAILIAFILLAALLTWVFRAREKQRLQEEARRMLEVEVAARTADLVEANRRFRSAREELAQASRLGTIGQITAGVAHEINQPVAAIRGFAENAGTFLDRGEAGRARENLGTIVSLTERIGAIVTELRTFARRSTPALGPVEIAVVIDGALLLVGDRIRERGVAIEREGAVAGLRCVADRVRLEQILVNLIQNALDALGGCAGPRIRISVEAGDEVEITVADNGPGIAPEVADNLFTPFVTGKADGLGLGLGIARDIAREFGGALDQVPSPLGGAAFRLTVRRA
ncbi:ATP-binding protein [Sphingopyxis sp. BSN-002]|uniref:sensor histidine kinase n=1 Tax=Sphingopyxis sp. BSN-002 TaxID=2911495 RepID=UPI001EDC904E|nr:ATP-binding protein [Sphingopyxis sp. BSN-002]UKK85330.1 ATP-binding protein [Sphingopyxis sp. BSN-002]